VEADAFVSDVTKRTTTLVFRANTAGDELLLSALHRVLSHGGEIDATPSHGKGIRMSFPAGKDIVPP
jgi:hypothetical protein